MAAVSTAPAVQPVPTQVRTGAVTERVPAGAHPIRVVVAVQDTTLGQRVGSALNGAHGEFELVAETRSCSGARSFAHAHRACVLVLDLSLPGAGASIALIGAESPEAEILVHAPDGDAGRICSALRAGATGYLLPDQADETLRHAVRCAAEGHGYLVAAAVAARARAALEEPRRRRFQRTPARPRGAIRADRAGTVTRPRTPVRPG